MSKRLRIVASYISVFSLISISLQAQSVPSREFIRAGQKLIAIETAASGSCAGASSTLPFRSTGNNGGGTPNIAAGAIDQNWKLVSSPGTMYGGSQKQDLLAASFLEAVGSARFVQPAHADPPGTFPGYYVMRQRLDLSCHNPQTVSISAAVYGCSGPRFLDSKTAIA